MTSLEDDPVARAQRGATWVVTRRHGSAADLHGLEVPEPAEREIWILVPDRPALVLGSTQADDIVDHDAVARRGLDVVRRRSGGGVVLLDPTGAVGAASTSWIDVVIPRGDPRWLDDVGRSMHWLGEAWVRALAPFGIAGEVHRAGLERSAASTLVCFAGIGPGEVVVGDRKVVGISQRRTRGAARFQCLVNLAPGGSTPATRSADIVVDLLREPVDADDRAELATRLRDRVVVVDASARAVADALVAALV